MTDIVERLKFDAIRCELQFSKGVAGNITEAAAEIERLRLENESLRAAGETGTNPFATVWCRNTDADERDERPMRRWQLWWLRWFGSGYARCWRERGR